MLENSKFLFSFQFFLHRAMQDQASFRAKYNFAGTEYQKYRDVYQLHSEKFSLPKTWSVEPGTTDIGHDHCHGEWIFHGLFALLKLRKTSCIIRLFSFF